MGAKVGNIGGGMVELFSQEWNDTASTHTITLTSAQIEEIAKYDFLVTTNTNHYAARAGAAFRTTCIFYVPHLLDFFNNSVNHDQYFGTGFGVLSGNDFIAPFFSNSSNTFNYIMRSSSSGSVAGTSEIKFYGLKL